MRHALLIGVQEYERFSPTKYTDNDVDLMYETLTEFCDFEKQNVLPYKLGLSSSMTPGKFLEGIEDFCKSALSGHTILFFFGGHGCKENNETYLLLPSSKKNNLETTAIRLEDIADKLRQDGKTCIRIFDACHSGIDVRDGNKENVDTGEFIRSIAQDVSGWITLAGCAPDQNSYCDPKLQNGIFTHYLCEEIRGYNNGDYIYPEVLKIAVSCKVEKHALSWGFSKHQL